MTLSSWTNLGPWRGCRKGRRKEKKKGKGGVGVLFYKEGGGGVEGAVEIKLERLEGNKMKEEMEVTQVFGGRNWKGDSVALQIGEKKEEGKKKAR